ncbi:hypothetical protein SKAU_G00013310 [Synaphobranchus kaupii]|uniref:Uncharacterized protein n=1 Tax=Synaphobranchus kaupii TaxID=118154 RepID=A0A9Q1GBL4_SYNKA|nr:hypothetical protein SKAU_G00013310 [Synaphobranchus kaupii]
MWGSAVGAGQRWSALIWTPAVKSGSDSPLALTPPPKRKRPLKRDIKVGFWGRVRCKARAAEGWGPLSNAAQGGDERQGEQLLKRDYRAGCRSLPSLSLSPPDDISIKLSLGYRV